jgi:FkbM family methyltransferase
MSASPSKAFVRQLRARAGLAVVGAFRRAGFELTRRTRMPTVSLLGVRNLPIQTIIDVGANEGQFAKEYLEYFPKARVVSFEPVPQAYDRLAAWAASDGRVTVIKAAVGEANGKLDMFEHVDFTASSSLLKTTKAVEERWPKTGNQRVISIDVTTLDDALAGVPLTPGVLVKIDVQGYEDRVIRGASRTLRATDAAIIEIDLDSLYDGQASFSNIVVALEACGLSYAGALNQTLDRDGHVIFFDAVFLRRRS